MTALSVNVSLAGAFSDPQSLIPTELVEGLNGMIRVYKMNVQIYAFILKYIAVAQL